MSPLTEQRAKPALAVTLPPGWQRLHTLALIGDALADRSSIEDSDEYDPAAMEQLRELLMIVAQIYLEGNVLLTALRLRAADSAFDVLTLAVPHAAAAAEHQDAESGPYAHEPVEIGIEGTCGRLLLPQEGPPTDGDPFVSCVQVISLLAPTRRGAILTLLSTTTGAEGMLEEEADQISSSLRLDGDESSLGDVGLANPLA